jgi:hypothetical protein
MSYSRTPVGQSQHGKAPAAPITIPKPLPLDLESLRKVSGGVGTTGPYRGW